MARRAGGQRLFSRRNEANTRTRLFSRSMSTSSVSRMCPVFAGLMLSIGSICRTPCLRRTVLCDRDSGRACQAGRRHRHVFVACAGDRLVGFAHFQPAGSDDRWRGVALGASVGVFDVDPVWEAVLTHAVRAAGLRGVKRLFARVPQDVPEASSLRRLGWSAYAVEVIFAAHGLTARPAHRVARPQQVADTWAIHQLYNASVPRQVQEAEAYTSQRWETRTRGTAASGIVTGYLIEDGHQLIGYARVVSRGDVHLVELLSHPQRSEVLPDLIASVLAPLAEGPVRRVYCAVRGYQSEARRRRWNLGGSCRRWNRSCW